MLEPDCGDICLNYFLFFFFPQSRFGSKMSEMFHLKSVNHVIILSKMHLIFLK